MADDATTSTPLLTNSSSNLKPEDIIEPYLKILTWRQIFQVILISFTSFFMAQQTFISIFTEAKQTWHCINPGDVSHCNASFSFCQLPSDAWTWDNPAYISIVSEWFLECAGSSIISGLPASAFFVGCIGGGIILLFIGDSYGRKKMLVLSCLVLSLSSFFIAFSNNVWIYSGLRFISGMGRAAIGSCGLVLTKEMVGKQWQGKVVNSGFLMFTFGFMFLPAAAYFTQNYSWRVLYLVTSVPAFLYCILLHFCVYESPRWLLTKGRKEEVIAILKSISSSSEVIDSMNLDLSIGLAANQDKNSKGESKLTFFKFVMERREFFIQLLLCMIINSGIGLVYYGMALGVNNLDFNRYWSVVFNASLQIPSIFLIVLTVSKWKRRKTLLTLSIIAGVCCILLCFTGSKWKYVQVALEVVSFFCSCTSFSLLLIYTSELFPIYIRNSAVAMVWLALMLGGAISPVLIAAGGDNKVISYGVFGIMIIITGSLVIILPETLGSTILFKENDVERHQTSA